MRRPTSSAADPGALTVPCAGVTLFEMMVALAVLALATSLVTLAMVPRRADAVLVARSEALAQDLQFAAASARQSGGAVRLFADENGYRIPALSREVRWEDDLSVAWQELTPTGWQAVSEVALTGPSLSTRALRVQMRMGTAERTVEVAALTGQVVHD